MAKSSTSYKTGQSGNPGGRRRKTDEERQAEEMFAKGSPDVVRQLEEILRTGRYNAEPLTAREFATLAKLRLEHTRVGDHAALDLGLPDDVADYRREDWQRLRALCDAELSGTSERAN
ncbi:MAG: hypothetical protein RIF41_41070 [Polyangiaceae bacterium]